jgi:hypothetical protein
MSVFRGLNLLLLLLVINSRASWSADLVTYFPSMNLERFVADQLDVRTLGIASPRAGERKPGPVHFSDLGMRPATITAGQVTFERPHLDYVLQILSSGDYNKDGIEDLMICFTQKSKRGAVQTARPYVLTRTTKTGAVLAVAYPLGDKLCV